MPSPAALKKMIAQICKKGRAGEIPGNQGIILGVRDYAITAGVSGAEFEHEPVSLGRAGRRFWWAPFLLKINGKRYVVFFDPRRKKTLTRAACRFIFSIMHTYIREPNKLEYGDVGFIVLHFANSRNGARKVFAHVDDQSSYLTDKQIGGMIDAVYRIVDDVIERKKTSAPRRKVA